MPAALNRPAVLSGLASVRKICPKALSFIIETSRDMISGLHDVHLLTISNRMNEIMKVLTIFTALFIPLNFIVGVYGMNFENMPELKWEWGYVTALLMMAVIGISMLIYFKSKKWL